MIKKHKALMTIFGVTVFMAALFFIGTSEAFFKSIPDGSKEDRAATRKVAADLQLRQPTPTDISYSLERYNLIRRAYWVNGQREKARTIPCPIPDVPLGYVVLFTNSGAVVGRFVVEGKVSSLNSFLTPCNYDEYKGNGGTVTHELPDIDGSYGENDGGIFFFTPDGKYIEWNGIYLYSDIPFEVASPIVKVGESK